MSGTGRHHIVFKMLKVGTAHIGFNFAGARIHSHHTASQEGFHIHNGVARRHHAQDFAVGRVVVKHPHFHFFVERLHDFLVALSFRLHAMIAFRRPNGEVDYPLFGGFRHFRRITGIGVGVSTATFVIKESLLRINHVLRDGFFRHTLHARIDGGVDFQAIAIDIIVGAIFLFILFAPAIHRVVVPVVFISVVGIDIGIFFRVGFISHKNAAQFFTEIGSNTIFVGFHFVLIEDERSGFQCRAGFRGKHSRLIHLVEHHIAALLHTLRKAERIVVRRIFTHSHQGGGFLHIEVLRFFAEIHPCCTANAHSIVQKVELIEIHLHDFILGVELFNLDGDCPLDGFLQGTFKDIGRFGRIELLRQLLCNRTTAAGTLVAHNHTLDKRAKERLHINAGVLFKSHIFGGDESVFQVGRHLLEIHIGAIAFATIKFSHFHAIGSVDGRGISISRIHQLFHLRHVANHAMVDEYGKNQQKCQETSQRPPHHLNDSARAATQSFSIFFRHICNAE